MPRSTLRALVPRALPPAPPRAGHTLAHPSRRTVGARPAGRTAGHGENVPPWRRVLALPPGDPAWAPCPTQLSTSSRSVPHRSTSSTEPAHSVREGRRIRRAATRRPGRRTSRTRVTVDTVPGSQDTSCRLCTLSGFPVDELRRAAHGCAQGPDDGARPPKGRLSTVLWMHRHPEPMCTSTGGQPLVPTVVHKAWGYVHRSSSAVPRSAALRPQQPVYRALCAVYRSRDGRRLPQACAPTCG